MRFKIIVLNILLVVIITFFPIIFLHELGHASVVFARGGSFLIEIYPLNIFNEKHIGIMSASMVYMDFWCYFAGFLTSLISSFILILVGLKFKKTKRLVLIITGGQHLIVMLAYWIKESIIPRSDFKVLYRHFGVSISNLLIPNLIFSIILIVIISYFCFKLVFDGFN